MAWYYNLVRVLLSKAQADRRLAAFGRMIMRETSLACLSELANYFPYPWYNEKFVRSSRSWSQHYKYCRNILRRSDFVQKTLHNQFGKSVVWIFTPFSLVACLRSKVGFELTPDSSLLCSFNLMFILYILPPRSVTFESFFDS